MPSRARPAALSPVPGDPFEQNLRQAFDKLAGQLPDDVIVFLDVVTGCLAVLPSVETDYDPAMFAALARSAVTSSLRTKLP
jgi:hypothetical protein